MPTVIVYWEPGRNEPQKKNVARRITEALVEEGNARLEDVLVIFQNIERGDQVRGSDLLGLSTFYDDLDDGTGGNSGS